MVERNPPLISFDVWTQGNAEKRNNQVNMEKKNMDRDKDRNSSRKRNKKKKKRKMIDLQIELFWIYFFEKSY